MNTVESPMNHTKYNDIISTLPRQENVFGPLLDQYIHEYQGFWFRTSLLENIMSVQENFIPQPNDIIICTHPKCGTTWLKALCSAILTRTQFNDFSSNPLFTKSPHDIVPWIEISVQRNSELSLFATHIPYTSLPKSIVESKCKIVYLSRDPKDLFISIWQFVCKLRKEAIPLETAYQYFCKGINIYGPCWDHILGYWKASLEFPERILFIKYEDLMNDTCSYVKRLAEFLDFPFSAEEERQGLVQKIVNLCSFETLSNLEVNRNSLENSATGALKIENNAFFRKGKVGDWKNYLTAEMGAHLDQITEQKFSGSGLSFQAQDLQCLSEGKS
ncbi:cytosolic sulfotransferase 18 [Manihot esculenta]|uniref:Sulfotransferase n=1 Tax=Manihot esculenta TaxID=3983 RepID=A0A2C9VIT3_MANES|nr:cytosolic sulfotransferase 18 [Manihot esculenta]OAY45353.1 hypothetical protein MANES_07G053600v8 [Manihot esculenta]